MPRIRCVVLRQVNLDGSTELLAPQTLEVSLDEPLTVVTNTANPIRHGTTATLQYAVRDREPVQVELYNVLGQRVRTLRDGWSTPGAVTTLRIPTADLASGKYFLRITGRSFTRTENVSIVR